MKRTKTATPLRNPIGWCDDTGNMVIGCGKVSPGCLHCYAEHDTPARVLRAGGWPGAKGRKVETWGPVGERWPVEALAKKALRLNKLCICDECRRTAPFGQIAEPCMVMADEVGTPCGGTRRRIRLFADSNSDWLDDRWRIDSLAGLMQIIHASPNLDLQLLTKRPENCFPRMEEACVWFANRMLESDSCAEVLVWLKAWRDDGKAPAHVHLGVSVEDQKRADERITELLKIPAAVRWLSLEPLLEEVSLSCVDFGGGGRISSQDVLYRRTGPRYRGDGVPVVVGNAERIDWLVIGGESDQPGAPARPCNVEWVRSLVRQGRDAGVPCYVKQLGDHCQDRNDAGFEGDAEDGWPMDTDTEDVESGYQGAPVRICFKSDAGADPAEWPADLRVREFPKGATV